MNRTVFGMGASFDLYLHCVIRKFRYLPKQGNFFVNSGLRKFRHGASIAEACYQLSSRKVDAQSMINWTFVGQLS